MPLDRECPSVSVIIPCRNEEALIGRCLDSILANDYPVDRLEIIVADGMSQDGTRAIAARFAKQWSNVRFLNNAKGTIPAAMNLSIKESSGQFILKMDAHSTYPADYIRECVRYLTVYQADMAGGMWSITPRNGTLMAEAIALALSHWFAAGNAYVKTGSREPRWADTAAFGCWRRETFEKLGTFDERLTGSSDMDLNLRLRNSGGRILLVPQIKIAYYADADLKSFWDHNFSDGIWATYPLRFGKRASSWRHWIPFGFVLSLFFWILALPIFAPAGDILASIAIAYGVVNVTAAAQLCTRRKNWKYMSLLPIVFATRHVAHGIGALYGILLVVMPGLTWSGRRSAVANNGYTGKRLLDVIGSLVGLAIFSSVFFMLCILIKLDSTGPAMYRGERVGRNGKLFNMLKFRTMYWKTTQADLPITPERDPSVTKVGAVLRKLKLDELPQLINVLKGEMSLVGPRPEASFYFQYYVEDEKRAVLSVRPGMTDYGSLRFHDEGKLLAGSTDPIKTYVEQIRHEKVCEQLRYIREQSFVTDLKIILRTIATIISTRFRQSRTVQPEVSPRA